MAKFTVDRKTWFRGQSSSDSKLLREDGQRCCIGFVAQQCGITDTDILNVSAVGNIKGEIKKATSWPAWFLESGGFSTEDLTAAYLINDNIHISDSERESQLVTLFAKHGDVIEFVG